MTQPDHYTIVMFPDPVYPPPTMGCFEAGSNLCRIVIPDPANPQPFQQLQLLGWPGLEFTDLNEGLGLAYSNAPQFLVRDWEPADAGPTHEASMPPPLDYGVSPVAAIPEPSTYVLLVAGLVVCAVFQRRWV